MTRTMNLAKAWWLGVRAQRKVGVGDVTASSERAFIYVREACVADSRDPGGKQLRRLREYALREGMTVVIQAVDAPASGMSDDRAGFTALLAAVSSGGIDIVLVDDLERISRSAATLNYFMKLASNSMVRVVTVGGGTAGRREFDPSIAAIVRRVHKDYAAGLTSDQIAEALSGEGVPLVRLSRRRRPH